MIWAKSLLLVINMQVVLASASPRRLELLQQIGVKVLVQPSSYEEAGGSAREAGQVVLANAKGKAAQVAAQVGDQLPVIGADTIVVIDNDILGKPKDAKEALAMLKRLAGRDHVVMTGVAIAYKGRLVAEVCETKVYFLPLGEEKLKAYVATGEPLDKAGAYGIQGKGAVLVEKIIGCYNNVVGLPLSRVYQLLTDLGVKG